eukprot:gnl/Spiro4/24170_TR11990_c0_g1_i1.p1 gnl/Spiro4/24170_TR11990_c0_g1~~gnl/Spiro4/24170_TR11990_c0_g1_i1.p1  ORF type:complete len:442 (-),score=33.83 gnl/Spiro4/24170_TR11990_c0_g1_i1:48-1343(-)
MSHRKGGPTAPTSLGLSGVSVGKHQPPSVPKGTSAKGKAATHTTHHPPAATHAPTPPSPVPSTTPAAHSEAATSTAPAPARRGGRLAPLKLDTTVVPSPQLQPAHPPSLTISPSPRPEEPALSPVPITAQMNSKYDIRPTDLEEVGTLGEGSSGLVKKVRHIPTGEFFALKVIPLVASNKEAYQGIIKEVHSIHEAGQCGMIVRFEGVYYHDGCIHIALEYMDGGSILDIVQNVGAIPEPVIAKIADQVLNGLNYLHTQQRIIHRDIKPANLLFNSRGEVKIADFGVSGQLKQSVSQAMSWVGTVLYMSPERIKGTAHSFDSDIWSLGLTLLECALGRFPYDLNSSNGRQGGFFDILYSITVEPAPVLPSGREFSREFCDFIAACLQKDPRERPSAQTLLSHPFILLHKNHPMDATQWIRDVVATRSRIQA